MVLRSAAKATKATGRDSELIILKMWTRRDRSGTDRTLKKEKKGKENVEKIATRARDT